MNRITVEGKISRLTPVKYSPSGVPVLEFVLAVPQLRAGKTSVGYFPVLVEGDAAEEFRQTLRIGTQVKLEGTLWSRSFKNRQGNLTTEFKIILEKLGGENEKNG